MDLADDEMTSQDPFTTTRNMKNDKRKQNHTECSEIGNKSKLKSINVEVCVRQVRIVLFFCVCAQQNAITNCKFLVFKISNKLPTTAFHSFCHISP